MYVVNVCLCVSRAAVCGETESVPVSKVLSGAVSNGARWPTQVLLLQCKYSRHGDTMHHVHDERAVTR